MKPKETIPTYIINLESRIERKNNVLNEFKGKDEFDIRIVEAIKHEVGAIGLWETIKHILNDLANKDEEYILICEDDHQFTSSYSKEILFHSIDEAIKEDADTLCGGIHWFNSAVEVSNNLFWVEFFTATQFIIVFRKFWEKILGADFGINDAADFKMSQLTNNKFVIYPFISTQKDYGYSDCTLQNNVEGRMKELFGSTSEGLGIVKKIFRHYRGEPTYFNSPKERSYKQSIENFENIVLPTYIIHFPERIENKEYIEKQFAGRTEFDITIVEAVKHETRQYSVWMTIRKIVQMAIDNDDDVIIICEDDHEFTEH
jgi:GR25 family glycosyltransferase involved in LPS biosynthesis